MRVFVSAIADSNKGWMHLNNGGINRPSLLSGGEQAKAQAPGSGRILADMEGRAPVAAARAQPVRHSNPRRVLWLFAATAIVLAAALLAWVLAGYSGEETSEYSLTPESAVGGHPDAPIASSNDGAAMIVDSGAGTPVATPAVTPPSPEAPGAAPVASTAAAAQPATQPAAARRPAPAARPSGSKGKDDPNLLGTLLGIIKEEDKPKQPQQAQTMDDLIAKIEADQHQRSEDERAAFERVASKKSASTESSIQAQLRRCPGANTLQGIDCRRKICAKVTGTDPACPRM